jgi:hypothetical protein
VAAKLPKEKVMDERRLDNFRSLSPEEVEEWCEGKSLEEIEDAMRRDSSHLREALDIGIEDLPRGRGIAAVETVIEAKLEEHDAQQQAEAAEQHQREVMAAQARNDAEGLAAQQRFLARHPEFTPSLESGAKLQEAYLAIDPDATEWDDTVLEKAYCNMVVDEFKS